MDVAGTPPRFDSTRFRQVLGNYPTGVTIVTTVGPDGRPAGLAIGSFTSVSLDPPLVAFLPDKNSRSWPQIRDAGVFCVNVLSAEQEHVCRTFASKAEDKFQNLSWRPAVSGSPMLDNAAAWIDCEVEAVYEAGDHYIVIGRVWDLDAEDDVLPLLFFRGGYGQFAPLSLAAIDDDLLDHLRVIDLGRGEMEAVAAELHTECIATAAIGDELVLLATAGRPRTPGVSTRVGQRVPFVPAFGAAFLAWASEGAAEAVLRRWWPALPADLADNYRRVLERVRTRGFSIGLGLAWHAQLEQALSQWYANPASLKARDAVRRLIDETAAEHYDPVDLAPDGPYEVCTLNAPVFGPDGDVLLVMSLYGFPDRLDFDEVQTYVARLLEATQKVTRVSRGRVPA